MIEIKNKMLCKKHDRNFIEEDDNDINHKKFKLESLTNNLEPETSCEGKISNNVEIIENRKKKLINPIQNKNNSIFDECGEENEFIIIKQIIEKAKNFEDIEDDFSYLIYNDFKGAKINPKVKELFESLKQDKNYIKIEEKANELSIDFDKKLKENDRMILTTFLANNKSASIHQNNNIQDVNKNTNSRNTSGNNSKIANNLKNSETNNTTNINNNINNSNNKLNSIIKSDKDKINTINASYNSINNKLNSSQQQTKLIPIKELKVKKFFFVALLYTKINIDTVEIINNGLTDLSLQILLLSVKFNNKLNNKLNKITHLNLSSNPIKTNVAYLLGQVLNYNTNIIMLDVSRCSLDDRCIYSIANGANLLNENSNKRKFNLEKINFKDNLFTNNSDESLEKILLNCPNLKWLNLTNIKLGNIGACKLFNMLLNNIEFFENFKVLLMIGNGIHNEKCLEILSNILKNKKCGIKTLNLSKNAIGKFIDANTEKMDYLKILLSSFKNKNLEQGNKSVAELLFLNCELGVVYTDDICEMLCNNNTLSLINFYGNNFSNQEDFEKILTIFSNYDGKKAINFRNNTLKSLDLSKNDCSLNITNEFLKIFDGLNLEYLDINQNQMNEEQKDKFKEAVSKLSEKIKIVY